MNYYTSDTHFCHANIIKYTNRPFADADAMDRALIAKWNGVVGPEDDVWHCGDFCLGKQEKNARRIVPQLKGRVHLVFGNHDDRRALADAGVFASLQTTAEFWEGKDYLYLHHYACRVWPKSHHGSFMLYGHSHSELPPIARSIDIGVDEWEYTPVTVEQIKRKLQSKGLLGTFTPHHGRGGRTPR